MQGDHTLLFRRALLESSELSSCKRRTCPNGIYKHCGDSITERVGLDLVNETTQCNTRGRENVVKYRKVVVRLNL